MQLRDLMDDTLRNKWSKATAISSLFRSKLEKEDGTEAELLSIGIQALNDMMEMEQALVFAVGQLNNELRTHLLSYSSAFEQSISAYAVYMAKLKPRKGSKAQKATIQSQMQLALSNLSRFTQDCGTILSLLSNVDSRADAYPYLKRTNKLTKFGKRVKKALETCVNDSKRLCLGFIPLETVKEEITR